MNVAIPDHKDNLELHQFKKRFSRITFTLLDINYELFFKAIKRQVRRLWNIWYEEGIKFKEYYNRRRVYLGRQPTYQDIQALKK